MSSNGKHDHRKTYWKIWGALILLTVITVWTSYYDFGTLNIVVALLIATTKATLVGLFFMHLIYDNKLDVVVFTSSFLFLAIFVGLTASDLLDRTVPSPVKVSSGSSSDMGDVAKYAKSSPELVSEGQKLYTTNCASCHGSNGKGDGPASAAFNPKPRNFTSGEWKQGGKPTQIFQTITTGFNSMPSFAALPPEQRWALVHYVRTFSPNKPDDSASDIASLVAKAGSAKQPIPVRLAMALSAVPDASPSFDIRKSTPDPTGLGGEIYTSRCAGCHGANGQGGVKVRVLGSNPYSYLSTASFAGSHAAWVGSMAEFVRINTEGLPGFGKPAINDLTSAQWQALYGYVQQLAGVR